jgi:hypothetical protein
MKIKTISNGLFGVMLLAMVTLEVNAQNEDYYNKVNAQNEDYYNKVDAFFTKYVKNDLVDYNGIKNSPEELDFLTLAIQEYYPEGIDSAAKAFYINAYNILVIQQIVDNYPVESVQEIAGFFDETKFKIGSKSLTLNELENKILRKEYRDYRLYFVLVCGALGCPPIANFSNRSDVLDKQLDDQTIKSFNNPKFIYEKDKKIQLSQIFNWYSEDFGAKSEIIELINSKKSTPLLRNSVSYYPYDWQLNKIQGLVIVTDHLISDLPEIPQNIKINLQTYTAGTLLDKGRCDITLFNSLYTQTKSNWLGVDYSGSRESFYTTLIQATLGTSKNKRINLGFDVSFRGSAKRQDKRFGTLFDVFSFKNNDSTRVGISSLGPRLKWIPFSGNTNFSIQSTFTVPTTRFNEGKNDPTGNLSWLDWSRFTSWNQLFYTYNRGKFQLFAEADILARIRTSKSQITHVDLPVTLIGSFFPTSKWTVYAIGQHNTRYTCNINPMLTTDFVIPMNFSLLGLGLKYQLVSNITLELLYTNFVRGVNTGLGETFNFGIKYLTK